MSLAAPASAIRRPLLRLTGLGIVARLGETSGGFSLSGRDVVVRTVRTPLSVKRQRTRDKTLEAAREQFSRNRYGAVTWATLSAATGLSTGAIAKQFKTKADIWRAAMECEPPCDGVLRYGEDLDDALRDLVQAYDGGGQEEIVQALAKAQQLLDKVDAIPRSTGEPCPGDE